MYPLCWRFGTVSSGKTVRLLVDVHQYNSTHTTMKAFVIKPSTDDRHTKMDHDAATIWSRVGLSYQADLVLSPTSDIPNELPPSVGMVFVDEAQFLTQEQVIQLCSLTSFVPVVCYGLRTTFRGDLFEGSKALFALADDIEEISTFCKKCQHKALYNMRLVDGQPTFDGPLILTGVEDTYIPVCRECFAKSIA